MIGEGLTIIGALTAIAGRISKYKIIKNIGILIFFIGLLALIFIQ